MRAMDHHDVERAVTEMVQVLAPYESADWAVPAGSLTWSCWKTAVHIAHDLTAYAVQLMARRTEGYLPIDLLVRPGTAPGQVLQVTTACGALLINAVSSAGPDARAWHWGTSDPSGFAALGVNEILMHTFDISQGLGITWLPPEALCAAVLARLFPDAPEADPVRMLLWSTGRVDLPGLPRRTSWLPQAAQERPR